MTDEKLRMKFVHHAKYAWLGNWGLIMKQQMIRVVS
jgi:hypothetical protein